MQVCAVFRRPIQRSDVLYAGSIPAMEYHPALTISKAHLSLYTPIYKHKIHISTLKQSLHSNVLLYSQNTAAILFLTQFHSNSTFLNLNRGNNTLLNLKHSNSIFLNLNHDNSTFLKLKYQK